GDSSCGITPGRRDGQHNEEYLQAAACHHKTPAHSPRLRCRADSEGYTSSGKATRGLLFLPQVLRSLPASLHSIQFSVCGTRCNRAQMRAVFNNITNLL